MSAIFKRFISLFSKSIPESPVDNLASVAEEPSHQLRKLPRTAPTERKKVESSDRLVSEISTQNEHIIAFGLPSLCKSAFLNAAMGCQAFPFTTRFEFEDALVKGYIPPFYTVESNGVTYSNVLCLDIPAALPLVTAHFADILRVGGTFKLFYIIESHSYLGGNLGANSEAMRAIGEVLRSCGYSDPDPLNIVVYSIRDQASDYDSREDYLHPKMKRFIRSIMTGGPLVRAGGSISEIGIIDKEWEERVSTPSHMISHGNYFVKEVVLNATQVKIAPSVPLQERRNKAVGVAQKEFAVFVSHAGPDKHSIAIPLKQELEARGISTFVDDQELKAGYKSAAVMEDAMESVPVGVFILSPEFAMRKWPMKELRCFLKRVERAKSGEGVAPTIVPVFYRLSVKSCKDGRFYDYDQETGVAAFRAGFFDDKEIEKEEALKYLADVASFAGIRNDNNVKNKEDCVEEADLEKEKREKFVECLADEIAAACTRRLGGEEQT